MDAERQVFEYGTYKEYIRAQRNRALRTGRQTRRYSEHRAEIASKLSTLCPDARTMLCIGSRSDVEILDFESYGFTVEGIDLYSTSRIVKCDMSKIDRHGSFAGRKFDIFTSIHSIEHCMDFEGFLRGMRMCQTAFACVTPLISAPTEWDCSAFKFAHPESGVEEIERAFPEFRVAWRETGKNTLRFVALRKM